MLIVEVICDRDYVLIESVVSGLVSSGQQDCRSLWIKRVEHGLQEAYIIAILFNDICEVSALMIIFNALSALPSTSCQGLAQVPAT